MGDAKDWSSSSNPANYWDHPIITLSSQWDDNAIEDITEDDLKGKPVDEIMELAMKNAEAKILKEEAQELAKSGISQEEITRHHQRLEGERQKQEALAKERIVRQAAWAAAVVAALALGFCFGRCGSLTRKGETKLKTFAAAGATKLFLDDPFVFQEGDKVQIGDAACWSEQVYRVDIVVPFRLERPLDYAYPKGTVLKKWDKAKTDEGSGGLVCGLGGG